MNLTHFQFHYTHRLISKSEWIEAGWTGELAKGGRAISEGAACFPMSNIIICTVHHVCVCERGKVCV